MDATFPSRRWTPLFLLAGAAGAVATVVVFALEFADDLTGYVWSLPFLGAYAAGVVAVRQRPEHVAARRLLVFGATATLFISAAVGIAIAFDAYGREWWLGPTNLAVQWLGLAEGAAMIALLAVYPDGVYSRRYEQWVVRAVALLAFAVPVALLLTRPALQPAWVFAWGAEDPSTAAFPSIASPFSIEALSALGAPLRVYLDASLALAPVLGAVLVGLRYRRLRAEQRQQIRWPLYGVLAVLVAPLSFVLHEVGVLSLVLSDLLVIAGLVALPAAVVIGLVKPDLFDIDRAMRRSLMFAPLWIAIAGAYVGVAALLGYAASGAGLQLVIAVTILATVMFEPARRRLVAQAARWAYGESISGEELVRRLGATLEHTLDLERLTREIATIAREGLVVSWTEIRVDGAAPVLAGEPPDAGAQATLSAPLIHAGEHLGEIRCGPRLRGRTQPSDGELFETLARQAALAIHNARLADALRRSLDEIRTQAEELAASRSRIVAAHESARRQIERDIHDGSQQELVALIARIGLARNQAGRDSSRLHETLGDLQSEARQALENLRQFASGIHPSVLSDHGLVEAIEIRSARLPIGVTIECAPELRTMRFDDEIEGAAYFFVSEGLANALKHAGSERAFVRICRSERHLDVEVADDGAGFEAGAVDGTGLQGLADRIEALGGSVAVDSSPGAGTTLTARLPMGDRAVA